MLPARQVEDHLPIFRANIRLAMQANYRTLIYKHYNFADANGKTGANGRVEHCARRILRPDRLTGVPELNLTIKVDR